MGRGRGEAKRSAGGSRGISARLIGFPLALLALALVVASTAFADPGKSGEEAPPNPLTSQLIQQAINSPDGPTLEVSPTDLQAAQQLPHNDLDRGEALQLLSSVFPAELESPAGIFDEMPPARFLSDDTAVMSSEDVAAAFTSDEEGVPQGSDHPVLIESSVPLRTEDDEGHNAPVDLSLEHAEGELQPANPIVSTGIPGQLDDGISLANGSVELSFPEADGERAPSSVEGSVAFYPNVQEDSDLVVAPMPGGVETMTQLRTPQAPRTQIVHVDLPAGASMKETKSGGVEAGLNGRTVLSVAPPSAVDAAGNPVPMTLAVKGEDVEITISPNEDSSFPILADPGWTLENWNWTWGGSSFANWTPVSYVPSYQPLTSQAGTSIPALDLISGWGGGATPNTGAQWQFWVPRYQADLTKYGEAPESFIEAVFTEGMMFLLEGNTSVWPGLVAGILDAKHGGWVSNLTWTGANGEISGWAGHANFFNYEPEPNTDAKVFVYGLITLENESPAKIRQAIAGKATTEVADHNTPQVNSVSIPSEGEWRNVAEVPVNYEVSDAGLGVAGLKLWPGEINYPVGCTGAAASPCPRKYNSTEPGSAKVAIKTSGAPEGLDTYRFAALDPLWSMGFSEGPVSHIKEEELHLRVDHSAPTVALSGSLTEQGSLGPAKPQYTLKYSAADGTRESATVRATSGTEGSGNGQFKHPADVALDPAEKIWVADQANNRIEKFGPNGEIVGAYGSLGSGNGQVNAPSGIEADEKGNIWVADTGNNRIEKFAAKGEYLAKFGTAGSGNGQLSSPKGIAIAPNGNVWVADTGNNRIQEFTSSGAFVGTFGAKGSGNLQFNEPIALDIGPGGKIWVADSANNRVEVLNEKGEFLAAYGTLGTGNGQFNRPAAVDVDARGNVYVLDANNGRVEQISERGEYLGQFGAKGAGSGQFTFSGASGLTTNTVGQIWVTDSGDNRIEEWNPPKGTRSGVRKVVVKMDGTVVQQASVTCPQGGCPIVGEWTMHSGEFTVGAHTVEVVATDGVELAKTEKLNITLNPPAPSVTLSGTMTEQASLGTELPSYALKLAASAEEGSGVSEAGRSTVATQITIDGKQVDTGSASCSTEACPITREWTLNPREYAAGSHTVIAKATDRYGQATTKELKITLNPPTPNVMLSGTMTEQATLGTSRPQYKLKLRASDGTLAEATAAEGGPTAAYALDETSGTSARDAAGSHTGTVTAPTWAEGKYGKALSFNGTSSCISVPNSVDLQLAGAFTLSAWVKPNNVTQWAPIFYKEAESFYSYSLFFGAFEAGHVQGYVADKPWEYAEVESPGKLTAGTWAHVAMTSDGTTVRLYVNGTQVDTGSAKTAMESKQPLLIGCAKNFGEYFNGQIDNVRIFGRALSAAEIETDKGSAVKVPAPEGPTAAYALDETSGTSAKDAAGGHTATVSGTASWVEGKYGKALNFNGENTCASVANSSDLQLNGPFTLEAWVKPANTTQWAPIFYKEGGEFYGYSVFFGAFAAGHIQGYISEHAWEYTEVESPGTLTANTWAHVAMTSDGTTMRLYVNGTQVDTSPASKAIATTGPLLIGCTKNLNEYFKGAIDNVRIFNRALTAAEVEADKGAAVGTGSGSAQTAIAKTEITLDGKVVDSSTGCSGENCSVAREWVLGASFELIGKHTIVAKATDGYGQWTSKTRTIEIQPDGTKPTLQLGGELAKAPEGWVQQESYGFTATATDPGGYGVTSLVFRIDGAAVASATQPCPEGGCEASISKGISMAPYSGGAHDAEVIATDGAGNVKTEGWTINVDPDGQISTIEATATMEAVEETSESNLVGESREEELPGTVAGLGFESTESGFAATGSASPMTVPTDPEEPIVIEIPKAAELFPCHEEPEEPAGEGEGEETANEECVPGWEEGTGELQPIEITPEDVSESSAPSHLVDGNASVSPNTESSTDSVVRPLSDGGMIFQAIRDDSAPEDYSFKVNLGEEQFLRPVDETHAEVYYSGYLPAFSIAALPAHDAIGTAVPTTLTVDDRDTVTLHVHYKAGHEGQPFVYPVVGGTGWEGGFRTIHVELESELPKEEYWESSVLTVGPPEPIAGTGGGALASSVGEASRQFLRVICGHSSFYGRPSTTGEGYVEECGNPFKHEAGYSTPWQAGYRGAFFYVPGAWAEERGAHACAGYGYDTSLSWYWYVKSAYQCIYGPHTSDGNGGTRVSAGHYLRAQAHWEVGHTAKCSGSFGAEAYRCPPPNPWEWEDKPLEIHLMPSGMVDLTVP